MASSKQPAACCPSSGLLSKMLSREVAANPRKKQRVGSASKEKYRHYHLTAEFETHDPDAEALKLPFLRKRSRIVEVVAAKDLIFALTHTGVCAAFRRGKRRAPCALVSPCDVPARRSCPERHPLFLTDPPAVCVSFQIRPSAYAS